MIPVLSKMHQNSAILAKIWVAGKTHTQATLIKLVMADHHHKTSKMSWGIVKFTFNFKVTIDARKSIFDLFTKAN